MCKIVSQKWKEKRKDPGRGDQSLLISPGNEGSCGDIDLKIAIGLLWQPLGHFLQYAWVSVHSPSMIKHLLNRAGQRRHSGFPHMCRYFTALLNTHTVTSRVNFDFSKRLVATGIFIGDALFQINCVHWGRTTGSGYDVCRSICNRWFIRTHSDFRWTEKLNTVAFCSPSFFFFYISLRTMFHLFLQLWPRSI